MAVKAEMQDDLNVLRGMLEEPPSSYSQSGTAFRFNLPKPGAGGYKFGQRRGGIPDFAGGVPPSRTQYAGSGFNRAGE